MGVWEGVWGVARVDGRAYWKRVLANFLHEEAVVTLSAPLKRWGVGVKVVVELEEWFEGNYGLTPL